MIANIYSHDEWLFAQQHQAIFYTNINIEISNNMLGHKHALCLLQSWMHFIQLPSLSSSKMTDAQNLMILSMLT